MIPSLVLCQSSLHNFLLLPFFPEATPLLSHGNFKCSSSSNILKFVLVFLRVRFSCDVRFAVIGSVHFNKILLYKNPKIVQ